jgi:hypothetical protein
VDLSEPSSGKGSGTAWGPVSRMLEMVSGMLVSPSAVRAVESRMWEVASLATWAVLSDTALAYASGPLLAYSLDRA